MKGIGQALLEQVVYDEETGQLLTGSLMDYAMAHADVMPEMFSTQMVPRIPGSMWVRTIGGMTSDCAIA